MAQVSFSINAIDRTRAAFVAIQGNLRRMVKETDPVQKKFAQLGFQMAGIGSIFALAGNEVRRVLQDINDIPGIPQSTIDSVNGAKESFADFRNQVSRGVAGVISFGAEVVQFAAILAGSVVYGADAASDAFWKLKNAGQAARLQKEKDAEAARLNAEANKRMADENAAAARIIAHANKLIDDSTRRKQSALEQLAAAELRRSNFGRSDSQILESLLAEAKLQDELAASAMRAGNAEASAAAQTRRLVAETDALELSARMADAALTEFFSSVDDEAKRLASVDQALSDFFSGVEDDAKRLAENTAGGMRAFGDQMAQMWSGVSDRAGQAFADMVLTGENAFKKLPEMAARAALEIMARMAIINPLMNALFGGFSGFNLLPAFFGAGSGPSPGGAAIGGPVSAGRPYIVGERGQELFVPTGSGRIVRNEDLGGGPSYSFTYNIASGVTRAELLPALKATQRETIARIAEVQRRGMPIAAAAY